MHKLPIALLLISATPAGMIALAQPASQNRMESQQRDGRRSHQGANQPPVPVGSEYRRRGGPTSAPPPVMSRRSMPSPGLSAPGTSPRGQISAPQFHERHRPEGVNRQGSTGVPRFENRQEDRHVGHFPADRHARPPSVSTAPRMGTEPPLRSEPATRHPHWNRDWRANRQYDWSNWRQRNRSVFHMRERYHDPYGWTHRLFSIGWRLWPRYYARSYWIDDPWTYRLPPAPPRARWIRYYNDALLVDTWTGEVIDIIPGFFW